MERAAEASRRADTNAYGDCRRRVAMLVSFLRQR
jgi:hypothetical protein